SGGLTSIPREMQDSVPIIVAGGMPGASLFPTVVPDADAIAGQICDHLLAEGFESFLYVGIRSDTPERGGGLCAALQRRLGSLDFTAFEIASETEFWESSSAVRIAL